MTNVMHNMSGVTCHESGVMCQMSRVICHQPIVIKGKDRATNYLLIMYYVLLDRCHMSDVTCQVSHVRCQVSWIPCQMSEKRKIKSQDHPLVSCHVICHVSGVICEVSSVTYQIRGVVCHHSGVSSHLPTAGNKILMSDMNFWNCYSRNSILTPKPLDDKAPELF